MYIHISVIVSYVGYLDMQYNVKEGKGKEGLGRPGCFLLVLPRVGFQFEPENLAGLLIACN